MFYLLIVIAAAIFLLSIITAISAALISAPFVPTPKRIIKEALKKIELKPNDTLYDLGAGNGRVLLIAAKEFGAQAVGFELAWHHFLIAKFAIFLSGSRKKAQIFWKNFLNEDISKADVVFVWLTPKGNKKLEEKFKKELRSGTRIVVYSSPLLFWNPVEIMNFDKKGKIFIYQKS